MRGIRGIKRGVGSGQTQVCHLTETKKTEKSYEVGLLVKLLGQFTVRQSQMTIEIIHCDASSCATARDADPVLSSSGSGYFEQITSGSGPGLRIEYYRSTVSFYIA